MPTTKEDVVSDNAIAKSSPALPPTVTTTTSTWYSLSISISTSLNGEFHSDSEKAQHAAAEGMTDRHCDGDILQRDSQPKDGGADGVSSDTTTSTAITPHDANANAPPDGV